MFNQNKIMNQDQRNRSDSHQRQIQEDDPSGPYFKIIKDYRSSHSPSIPSNQQRRSRREGKVSSELYSQSQESIKFKIPTKRKKIRHQFSIHSRKKRQISTRFRQENEVELQAKIQIWSKLWNKGLEYLQQRHEGILLHQITPSFEKTKKEHEKANHSLQQQFLCNSQPIFVPYAQPIQISEKIPEEKEIKNLHEQQKNEDNFISYNSYFENENSIFHEENNSFFFDRVEGV